MSGFDCFRGKLASSQGWVGYRLRLKTGETDMSTSQASDGYGHTVAVVFIDSFGFDAGHPFVQGRDSISTIGFIKQVIRRCENLQKAGTRVRFSGY
jgi:hypothetical protein